MASAAESAQGPPGTPHRYRRTTTPSARSVAVATAIASHGDYLTEQQAGFASSFDLQPRSSSLRAAEAIAVRLGGRPAP